MAPPPTTTTSQRRTSALDREPAEVEPVRAPADEAVERQLGDVPEHPHCLLVTLEPAELVALGAVRHPSHNPRGGRQPALGHDLVDHVLDREPVVDDDHVTREGALLANGHDVGDRRRLVPRGNDDVDYHAELRDNPARSPRATTFTATLRDASSIISSPNMTAPRRSSSVARR